MPKISIVIITFNSKAFIERCLDSVFNQGFGDFEVIVIDNGSKDETVSIINKSYPKVKLIANSENLGACKARNQAFEVARGSWILTLDCDVILEHDFLGKIITLAEESCPPVGMFQPKILNMDKKTIYSCGIYLSNLRRFYDIGNGELDNGQFNSTKYIFGVCSTAAIYKKEMLDELKEETGYFDERFFFLVEDVDLAWRAQRRGWKAYYIPEAVCYHHGNSSAKPKKVRQYLCFRNRYFLILKNDHLNMFRNITSILLYDLPRMFYLILTNSYTLRALREIKALLPKVRQRNAYIAEN